MPDILSFECKDSLNILFLLACCFSEPCLNNVYEEERQCRAASRCHRPSVTSCSLLSQKKRVKCRSFKIDDCSKLVISQGDITLWAGGVNSAIVNSTNEGLIKGHGMDAAIHDAAGPKLQEACRDINELRKGIRCPIGEARITDGFNLPVSHVIHTVGPVYADPVTSTLQLQQAYHSSFSLANQKGLEAIALPAISCGQYGFPVPEAAEIAVSAAISNRGNLKHIEFIFFDYLKFQCWMDAAEHVLSERFETYKIVERQLQIN